MLNGHFSNSLLIFYAFNNFFLSCLWVFFKYPSITEENDDMLGALFTPSHTSVLRSWSCLAAI